MARGRSRSSSKRDISGFSVIRPLPTAAVGRTVLKPYTTTKNRFYPPTVLYRIHLLGLELGVRGVAFQQQDRAVAACATTAVWSALQRVCRNEGVRAPTTSEITSEAVRHHLPEGRPFPSEGLRTEQMSDALRAFQFPPEHCQVASSPRYFMMQLHAYLRSGIPVILGIETGGEGHAVTAVGFRHDARLKDSVDIPVGDRSVSLRLRNLTYRQIYVHDDRLGPYARATLQPRSRRGPVRGARTSANCGSEEEKNGRRRLWGSR